MTLNPHFAHYWAHLNQTPPKDVVDEEELKGFVPHQVMEAWISEDHIHSYIPSILDPDYDKHQEEEVIVEPHDIKPHKIYAGKTLLSNFKKLGIK